jgi:hypothetical protein
VYLSAWWIQSCKIAKISQGMNKIPWPLLAIYCLEVKGVSVWFKHVRTIFFWNLRCFCIALLFLHFKEVLKIFRWHTQQNYNAYHSKSKVKKSSFLCGSIVTNDETILLTIEGKWVEGIVHMTKFAFLNLIRLKQVQIFISIHICGEL